MHSKSRSEYKLAVREQAKRNVGGAARSAGLSRLDQKDRIERGLKELQRVSAEGGDSKTKKVKNELTYLLNNYTPQYDARIEGLIDEWRRSGDPSYDPAIRSRLRLARQEHMRNHPV